MFNLFLLEQKVWAPSNERTNEWPIVAKSWRAKITAPFTPATRYHAGLRTQYNMQVGETETPIQIDPLGCLCPVSRRAKSRIIGCGAKYGCDFNSFGCRLCPHLAFQYRSWAQQHIELRHRGKRRNRVISRGVV